MLDHSSLDHAWSVLLDQFARRFDASETAHGQQTALQLRAFDGQTPNWTLHDHDVFLASTLAPLGSDPLVGALERLSPFLAWNTRGVFTDKDVTNRAYVEFVGPEGMIQTDRVRLGVYWHDRQTFYPRHRHNAVEMYHIVSGTALWQHVGEDWIERAPNTSVIHLSNEDHATRTADEPLLAFWSWLGDIGFDSYSMDVAPEGMGMGLGFRDFPGN